MVKIFLNAGHGGNDCGAVNKNLNLTEKAMTRAITDLVAYQLRNLVEICIFQQKESINEVVDGANSFNADICISIHMNACNCKASGVETLYHKTSTKGKILAHSIQRQLTKPMLYYSFKDRGFKEDTRNLAVLKNTKMPSCLVEVGFIDNDYEAEFVKDNLTIVSNAIATGIIDYLESQNLIIDLKETKASEQEPTTFIVPTENGLYDLYINRKKILINNKIETIDKYLKGLN